MSLRRDERKGFGCIQLAGNLSCLRIHLQESIQKEPFWQVGQPLEEFNDKGHFVFRHPCGAVPADPGNAESAVATQLQTSGTLILAQFNWCSILLDFPFTISALVINYLLYKSKLIPQWLSVLGLIGGTLWLATTPFRIFGVFPTSLEIFALIIMVQEMVFAVWLIVKGFNSSATTS